MLIGPATSLFLPKGISAFLLQLAFLTPCSSAVGLPPFLILELSSAPALHKMLAVSGNRHAQLSTITTQDDEDVFDSDSGISLDPGGYDLGKQGDQCITRVLSETTVLASANYEPDMDDGYHVGSEHTSSIIWQHFEFFVTPGQGPGLSSIVFAEIALLHDKGEDSNPRV